MKSNIHASAASVTTTDRADMALTFAFVLLFVRCDMVTMSPNQIPSVLSTRFQTIGYISRRDIQ